MASDYGQQVLRERRQLLGDLVTRLTGLQVRGCLCCRRRSFPLPLAADYRLSPLNQVDEARHSALLEACSEAVQHHQFPDTNPRHVAEQVDRCGSAMAACSAALLVLLALTVSQ